MINRKAFFAFLFAFILITAFISLFNSVSIDNAFKSSSSEPRVVFTGHVMGLNLIASKHPGKWQIPKIISVNKEEISNISILSSKKRFVVTLPEKGIQLFDTNGKRLAQYLIDKDSRIISSFASELYNPGEENIILLLGKKGEKLGRDIRILSFDLASKEIKVKSSYTFKSFDLWKVQVADVDGDKKKDISFSAYKKTPFHQEFAKRPFIFNWQNNSISPKWLGSRLSMPFEDYIFQDIDKDGLDELISIEINQQNQKLIRSYKWHDFGFRGTAVSTCFQDISVLKQGESITGNQNDIIIRAKENNISKWMILVYNNNKLVTKKSTNNKNLLYLLD